MKKVKNIKDAEKVKIKNIKSEQKHKTKKKGTGFTLVELIVVITILAILSTIAFVSFQSYTKQARDGTRLSDINNIEKSLGLYITEIGNYPVPDGGVNITYSGGLAWTQGTVGDDMIRNLKDLSKKPVDPLYGNEYTYSVTSLKTEYQVGAIADEQNVIAFVKGTYNGRYLRVQSGSLNWIISIPSIINTDIIDTDVQEILTSKKLVYNNYSNIPYSYNSPLYTKTGGFNYTNPNPLIYSGSIDELAKDEDKKLDFIIKLQEAYKGTILEGDSTYKDIIQVDTATNQTGAVYLVNGLINTNVGGIKASSNILPTINILIPDTTPKLQYASNCTSTGEIYYADSIGYKLATVTNTGAATWEAGKSILDLTCAGHIIVCSGHGSGYTITPCNVGTNIVGVGEDSYGHYFQWGNNGGTPFGNIITSATLVDASSYGPGTANGYYNNTTVIGSGGIVQPYDWTKPPNQNLWGDITNTNEARQGPCLIGYHIPTGQELWGIVTIGGWLNNGKDIIATLKFPRAGQREPKSGLMSNQEVAARYWSSSDYPFQGTAYAGFLSVKNNSIMANVSAPHYNGYSIRCFKN